MKKILVTGAAGQLGKCIQKLSKRYPAYSFDFLSKEALDITNQDALTTLFQEYSYDFCINAAGYTNVEKAETESDLAYSLNALAVDKLSAHCATHDIVLIHLSTDYVFDGNRQEPYTESALTNALNVYGSSKLTGEQNIQKNGDKHFIIRTSWLYSEYNHNFLNTVLRCVSQAKDMTITTAQIGSPTNANDLAEAIMHIIVSNSADFGLYHFSNTGQGTWYDFAEHILKYSKQLGAIKLAKTDHYRTFAARPKYSVLDTSTFEHTFNFELKDWKESLKELLQKPNDKN